MTGFGAALVRSEHGDVSVQGRSRNARGLEAHVHLPALLRHLEPGVLDRVRRAVLRGRVDVHVHWERPVTETLPEAEGKVVDAQMAWVRAVMFRAGIQSQPTLDTLLTSGLLQRLDVVPRGETHVVDALVIEAVDRMLQDMIAFRRTEGEKLTVFLERSLQELQRLVVEMEREAKEASEQGEVRWRRRIAALRDAWGADAPGESRLLSESVLLTQKADVTEELLRLHAHLGAMQSAIERGARGDAQGARVGVLLQECLRELSTIAAKGQSASLTHLTVDARVLVERMREQTLNLE